ncbi:hypothetical protein BGW38_006517, partial [Lunasporangiospora selenospora]
MGHRYRRLYSGRNTGGDEERPYDNDDGDGSQRTRTESNRKNSLRRMVMIGALGQLVSLCITTTTLLSAYLAQSGEGKDDSWIHTNNHYDKDKTQGIGPVSMPTTQSFLNYLTLAIVYTIVTIRKGHGGFAGWREMVSRRGLSYMLLALVDVEGNYFVVKAYRYTSLFSAMLLDSWTIPCVVLLSMWMLHVRFRRSHLLGVFMALVGLVCLLYSDLDAGRDQDSPGQLPPSPPSDVDTTLSIGQKKGDSFFLTSSSPFTLPSTTGSEYNFIRGDLYCLIGATLYAISNVYQEVLVRRGPPFYELVGQLGFWGTIISGSQILVLERDELRELFGIFAAGQIHASPQTGTAFSMVTGQAWPSGSGSGSGSDGGGRNRLTIVAAIVGFDVALFVMYSVMPLLFRLSSATFVNLSLLTSDFYGLVFGLIFFNAK